MSTPSSHVRCEEHRTAHDKRYDPAEELETQTVMFLVTEACNLRCVYCYEVNRSKRGVSEEGIKKIICAHMAQKRFKNISFDFFGGEPLLQFARIRNVVEWFHTRTWPKGHRFTISTNGTLLDGEKKRWLSEWRDCVIPMLSLDGTKAAHDRSRSNSYDDVVAHVEFFRENWPEQPARMTISPDTIDQVAEGIINIHSLGLPVEAAVVFEDVWGDAESKRRHLESYEEQLAMLVDFYAERPELPVPFILNRDPAFLMLKHEPGERFCGAGRYMAYYAPDGIRYPCHRFAPLSTTRPSTDPWGEQDALDMPALCQKCILLSFCPTCQGFNWEANGNTDARTTNHCEFFKLEVLASAKLLLRRIRASVDDGAIDTDRAIGRAQRLLGLQKLLRSGIHESIYAQSPE